MFNGRLHIWAFSLIFLTLWFLTRLSNPVSLEDHNKTLLLLNEAQQSHLHITSTLFQMHSGQIINNDKLIRHMGDLKTTQQKLYDLHTCDALKADFCKALTDYHTNLDALEISLDGFRRLNALNRNAQIYLPVLAQEIIEILKDNPLATAELALLETFFFNTIVYNTSSTDTTIAPHIPDARTFRNTLSISYGIIPNEIRTAHALLTQLTQQKTQLQALLDEIDSHHYGDLVPQIRHSYIDHHTSLIRSADLYQRLSLALMLVLSIYAAGILYSLFKLYRSLDKAVAERTKALATANISLQGQIKLREAAEKTLIAEKEKSERASLAKSNFLANMSHELRTPLNAIMGFSGFIQISADSKMSREKIKEYAADINQSATYLLALINDILDLSKVEAGQMRLQFDHVPLDTLITECLGMLEKRITDQQLEIIDLASPRNISMHVDALRFRQILSNVFSNAVKFTPDKGRITLDAASTKDHLTLSITDTGIGIAQEQLQAVFEPFGQDRNAYHHNDEGTGLGLALTKDLVEEHGGHVLLESELGSGTTVSIILPSNRFTAP